MDFTKHIVLKMYNDFYNDGIVVVPVYDIKTVDVRRDNFLTVYTSSRNVRPSAIGGHSYFEDLYVDFDFRGGKYSKYVLAKNKLKAWIEENVRGWADMGVYNILVVEETELSDKQRGMYRFVITVLFRRMIDYEYDIVFFDDFCPKPYEGFNLTPESKGVV